MAFTPETGSGVTGANSYAAVADADSYFTDRNDAAWTGVDAVKEVALIKATDHIERNYRDRWVGDIASSTQGLSWPRDYVYDDLGSSVTGVPAEVAYATYEFALVALSNDLDPDPTYETTGRLVVEKREKVDVLEEETKYSSGGALVRRVNRKAEGWLSRWLKSGSGAGELLRV